MSIPGEWYALCELSYKINACAYICIILWGVAEADHSLQFDNQGFSLLDWVLARVSDRIADIYPLSYLFLQSCNDDTNVGRVEQKPIPHICASNILRHSLGRWFCNHGHLPARYKMSVFISLPSLMPRTYAEYFFQSILMLALHISDATPHA